MTSTKNDDPKDENLAYDDQEEISCDDQIDFSADEREPDSTSEPS